MKGSQPPRRDKKGMPVQPTFVQGNIYSRSSKALGSWRPCKRQRWGGGSAEVTCSRESMFKINRPQTQNLFFPAVIVILIVSHPPHPAPVCLSPFCFSGQLSPKESAGLPAHRQELTQGNFTLTRCPQAKAVPPASSSLAR